jgi:error-prone DNA polymerase
MLNNQPMGFYQPFTLIKDAQRHGLKVLPVDITCSDWLCTLEKLETRAGLEEGEKPVRDWVTWGVGPVPYAAVSPSPNLALRLGLRYVKGLSEQSGRAIERERNVRPLAGFDDLRNRVPELRKDELRKLAAVGALNFMQAPSVNRRDALWQVERVSRAPGELYEQLLEQDGNSPLESMTITERVDADFRGTGLTIGKHPVAYHRQKLNRMKALRAIDLRRLADGNHVRVAGWVIVRQRPGTAKGFVFLTLEDETGVSNIIVTPSLFDRYRRELVNYPFLLIEGSLQNQDNVISVKASRIEPLPFQVATATSRDFH